MRFSVLLVILFLFTTSGCGPGSGHDVASVTGKVTYKNQPVADARIMFSPIAQSGSSAGPTSYGTTGADGQFTLETVDGAKGAVVGKHRVTISTRKVEPGADESTPTKVIAEEKLPAKYNTASTVEFEVPAAGTDQANFDLK